MRLWTLDLDTTQSLLAIQEVLLFLERDPVDLTFERRLHKVDYFLHARPIIPPWYHRNGGLFLSMINYGTKFFFIKTNSLNLLWGTYTQFCLYLSNPTTNLSSLSVFPLWSLPRRLYASRMLMYPSYILCCGFLSHLYISPRFGSCSLPIILHVYLAYPAPHSLFSFVGIQLVVPILLNHRLKVPCVLLRHIWMLQNIVVIDYHKIFHLVSKDDVHKGYECQRYIIQPKMHHQELIKPIP